MERETLRAKAVAAHDGTAICIDCGWESGSQFVHDGQCLNCSSPHLKSVEDLRKPDPPAAAPEPPAAKMDPPIPVPDPPAAAPEPPAAKQTCPHCGRSYKHLARHIKRRHPPAPAPAPAADSDQN